MRIVFCTDTLGRGGKERQIALVTRNMLDYGHEVFWITQAWSKGNDYLTEYNLDPSLVSVLQDRSYHKGLKQIKKLLDSLNADVVIGWDMKSCFWLLVLNISRKWLFINGSIRHGIRKNSLEHRFRSWIARLSPYLIANSEAGLKANKLKLNARRKVIYNAVDIPRKIREEEKKNIIEELHLSVKAETKIFLSVANLNPYKDYPTVLKALAQIDQEFSYLIIGEGPERKNIENTIKSLGLQDKVSLLGRRSDIQVFMQIADLFIHSSRGEGCSNAILEALAANLPVVASKVGGTPEILPRNLGWLFEYSNKDSLKGAMREALAQLNDQVVNAEDYRKHLDHFTNASVTNSFLKAFKNWKA